MSNQNKMSIKQVVQNEYKLILLLAAVSLALPLLSEVIIISDLSKFNNLQVLEKLGVIFGASDFEMTNVNPIIYSGIILNFLLLPLYASIIAFKLRGNRLIEALGEGIKSVGSSKFWKYILLVYLPYAAIIILITIGTYFIPETVVLNFISNLMQSTLLLVVVAILLVIVSIVLSTISAYLFIANVVYIRDDVEINQAFRAISSRERNKLMLFYFMDILISVLVVIGFGMYLGAMQPLQLLGSIFTIAINIIVVLMIKQVIFTLAVYVLFINVASKVSATPNNLGISQNKALVQNQTVEVYNSSTENVFEATVKPKKSNRKNRIKKEEQKIKPKRSIK